MPRAVLLDLLMATMDSIATWAAAAGDRGRGLAWRDAVTRRMIEAGRYVSYEALVRAEGRARAIPAAATDRLRAAWSEMRPWPDAAAVGRLRVPYAFVTNCSTQLAGEAVARSGLAPAFTLSAEEAGWYKPRPEIYALACARLGLDAGEVRYVAGAAYDAEGAAAAGLDTVFVLRRPPDVDLPPGIRVARSLGEALAGT